MHRRQLGVVLLVNSLDLVCRTLSCWNKQPGRKQGIGLDLRALADFDNSDLSPHMIKLPMESLSFSEECSLCVPLSPARQPVCESNLAQSWPAPLT